MKKYNIVITVIIVLMVAGVLFGILWFNSSRRPSKEFDYLKDYKDNEYMPAYISEEKMAKLYFNDFMYFVNFDKKGVYDLVNEEYRKKKFSSYEAFENFITAYENSTLESYRVSNETAKRVFYINLNDGRQVIFSTIGVMNYELFFDETTVEIE